MLIRVTKTVRDRGVLVRPDELAQTITDPEIDWYYSPFQYGDDALEYWKTNGESIKGYTGKAYTNVLYWDLDCKQDFEKVRQNAIKLVTFIAKELRLVRGVELFFSGNKGMHIMLHTKNEFTPSETSAICYNVALRAGVDKDVFDTSVYNLNRIFRVANTRHPDSGLFKIPMTDDEVFDLSEEAIRTLAETPREVETKVKAVNAKKLIELFAIKPKDNVISMSTLLTKAKDATFSDDFNPMNAPRGMRRCIYVLENGHFGPGERENALIRIGAYYKSKNFSYEQNFAVLNKALDRRAALHPDAEPAKEEDTHRILKELYSDGWRGGAYSCRTNAENPDKFLQSKCDLGNGPCGDELAPVNPFEVLNIGKLIETYVAYGNEALKEYPKTGNAWLDKKVRIRPRNFSLINGANGSGKTSLMINIITSLNQQQIYHVVFSLDMADTSLFEKLGATFTEFSQEEIEAAFNIHTRNDEVIQVISKILSEKLPYTLFDFTSSADSRHLESTLNKLKRGMGIDIRLALIDYAGRLIGDHDNEFANSSQNALMANDIAKRTDVHLMYLSQVSREKGDHTTELRSSRVAKFSGAWEENATFILNVWRPFGNGLQGSDNYMHVYIAKNRSGPLGEHVFWWEGKTGQVREPTTEEFKQYRNLCDEHEMPPPYEQSHEMRKELASKHPSLNYVEEDEEELPDSEKSSRFREST